MDVQVTDHGTVFGFRPLTPDASQWIADNVGDDGLWFGDALMVDHRYAEPLMLGMVGDGLDVN